ncbi:hypothetical protein [Streptomyces sp. NPDC127033]|uniref:hypothetical protein n=1 Tax=Streptomyces sp. NPDC127033 TaxID=3347110 RepID=UPI00364A0FC7
MSIPFSLTISHVRFMATAGAASLLMAGCSVNHENRSANPATVPPSPTLLATVDLRLPIEKYLFSDSEAKTIRRAKIILLQNCMRSFNVSYDFGTPAPDLGPRSLMDRRYGVTDALMAQAHGYHLGARDPRTHIVTPPAPPAGEALTVLTGSPRPAEDGKNSHHAPTSAPLKVNGKIVSPRGCAGEADAKLAKKDAAESGDLAQDLNGQSFIAAKKDARVLEVFHSWSKCMKGKGYSYPDPLAAMDDRKFRGSKPIPEELKVAPADIECKKQTNLVSVWFTVETSLQRGLLDKYEKQLTPILSNKNNQLAAAASVIKSSK